MSIHVGHVGIRLLARVQYIQPVLVTHLDHAAVPREHGRFAGRQFEIAFDGEFGAEYFGRAGFEREGARDVGGHFEAEFRFGGEGVEGRVGVGRCGDGSAAGVHG